MVREHSRTGRRPKRTVTDTDTDPDLYFTESHRKRTQRKDRQLCGQVQRAIAAALGAEFHDALLQSLWVVKVEPAPTLARLLVWVCGPEDSSPELIISRLDAVSGALRAEVAASIHRKQVPSLSFAVCDDITEELP
jgi:ribosome-binding factor A